MEELTAKIREIVKVEVGNVLASGGDKDTDDDSSDKS
jgi:hypothetical protein